MSSLVFYANFDLEKHPSENSMTSLYRVIPSQSKKREVCEILAFIFLNCEITYDFTNISDSNYGRKAAARRFDTINDNFSQQEPMG